MLILVHNVQTLTEQVNQMLNKTFASLGFIVILLLMSLSCESHAKQSEMCLNAETFTRKQAAVLEDAYELGKPYGLHYVMMAIAVKESTAGKFLINSKSGDYGVYGIKLKYAAIRDNTKGEFAKDVLMQNLIVNNSVSGHHAISTIREMKNYHRWDIKKLFQHYKDGKKVTSKGLKYAEDAVKLVKMFKTCGVIVKI